MLPGPVHPLVGGRSHSFPGLTSYTGVSSYSVPQSIDISGPLSLSLPVRAAWVSK